MPLYKYIIFDIIETVKNYIVIADHLTWGFSTNIQIYDLMPQGLQSISLASRYKETSIWLAQNFNTMHPPLFETETRCSKADRYNYNISKAVVPNF